MSKWLGLVLFILIVVVITLVVSSIVNYATSSFKRNVEANQHDKIQEAYREGHSAAVSEMEKALGIPFSKDQNA